MEKSVYRSNSRGFVDHGWLKSHHTFSFAHYFNPERMGFGALRVLNDDQIDGGTGFPFHPHRNMEIVSIPLTGGLEHKDSEGNEFVIRTGEVQVMSAGTGIIHSEYNHEADRSANFLQIWVLPKTLNTPPRYDQGEFNWQSSTGKFRTVVAPLGTDLPGLKINQDAYFAIATAESGIELPYRWQDPQNGLYLFFVEGAGKVAGELLQPRDAIALTGTADVTITVSNDFEKAVVLAIEVPMV